MNIRSKILLSIMAGAAVSALAIGAIVVFDTISILAAAAVVSVFCVIAAVIGLYVANSIVEPLNTAVDMIREMSRGHLGLKLNLRRGDEIGAMAKALDTFADTLRLTAGGAVNRIAADGLGSEVSSLALRNADGSERAKLSSAETSAAVGEGDAAVKRMAKAVDNIKASSDNNAKIIKMVNYMAFRARLLAFNAAIEAARAGEAGNGFAFVAGEMRNFAARCAGTANNIADMIEESVIEIDDGVKITEEAVKAVDRIVSCVNGKIDRQASERADAADQRGQRGLSARQKRYASFPYKTTYSAATLAFWAPMRAADAEAAFTIDDCEMWR